MNNEPTTSDVLEAVNTFATHVDQQFADIKAEIKTIKSTMVTKDYLDDKLSDLRGDLTVVMRKEDTKLCAVIDILLEKKIFTEADKKRVLTMEPFPQLSM